MPLNKETRDNNVSVIFLWLVFLYFSQYEKHHHVILSPFYLRFFIRTNFLRDANNTTELNWIKYKLHLIQSKYSAEEWRTLTVNLVRFQWHINLSGLFNAKAFILEQPWYHSICIWIFKGLIGSVFCQQL